MSQASDKDDTASDEGSASKGLYTFEQLLDRVQASPMELQQALQQRHALEVDGSWRAVRPSYLATVTELLLLTAVQQGWPLNAIPEQQMAEALQADVGYDPRSAPLAPPKYHMHVVSEHGS